MQCNRRLAILGISLQFVARAFFLRPFESKKIDSSGKFVVGGTADKAEMIVEVLR